jgi:hypothetical protein
MNNQNLLKAVEVYLDMIYYCDIEKLDTIFHPASSLFDGDEGKIFVDPIDNFRQDVTSRPSPASVNQKREEEILLIDYLSPLSAIVKLRLRSHENIFVDHLNFVKDGNHEWKIVAKVWHLEVISKTF